MERFRGNRSSGFSLFFPNLSPAKKREKKQEKQERMRKGGENKEEENEVKRPKSHANGGTEINIE